MSCNVLAIYTYFMRWPAPAVGVFLAGPAIADTTGSVPRGEPLSDEARMQRLR